MQRIEMHRAGESTALRRIHEEEEDPMAEPSTIPTRLLTRIALLLVVAALKSSYPYDR
jgi:hypothetical protein